MRTYRTHIQRGSRPVGSTLARICALALMLCFSLNSWGLLYELQCHSVITSADGKERVEGDDTYSVFILNSIIKVESKGLNLTLAHDVLGSMNTGTSTSQTNGGPIVYSKDFDASDASISFYSTYDYTTKSPRGTMPDEHTSLVISYPDGYIFRAKINKIINANTHTEVPVSKFIDDLIEAGKKMNARKEEYTVEHIDRKLRSVKNEPPEPVDLGLSVRWAPYNVGETQPDGQIATFGWADPTGHKRGENNSDFPSYAVPESIIGTAWDAATANWGKHWRLPTRQECQELIDRCRFEPVRNSNGVVTAMRCIGPNGNSIILPFFRNNRYGSYWSGESSPRTGCGAYAMTISEDAWLGRDISDGNNRFCKLLLRPVYQ